MPEAPNAVRELASDPTSRKKFLRQAGGTGVAASLAAFVAACGGDDESARAAEQHPREHADGEHSAPSSSARAISGSPTTR